ncbi:MAG: cell division protein FtsA [Candidatus Pacebacteria bacterium]|nr:cell division protein FtsA [Candidatus Paceibacterota bacterium]
MLRKISVGIDIGTYQVKVVITENIKQEDNSFSPNIIGTGFAESKGLRHGYIINMNDVTKCINIAVKQAEKEAKIKIKKAYISIGGISLSSVICKGSVMISKADSEITDLDVKNVLAIAESELPQNVLLNKKIIYSIPIAYKIDGQLLMGRPSGMHGTKLEARVLFVVCLEQHLNDLIKAVEEANVEVIDIVASPIAASIVNLTKTQKIAGCVLANIGSETVSLVVFENNIPISLEVFPIGSNDITNDIALGFRIPIDEAENIKIGTVSEIQYPKKKLDEIILARLSDIFDLIESHLRKIGRSGLLPAGIILTGGGSGIETIEDIARASLKLPSKIASINLISNIKNSQLKDSTWSVAYGLSMIGLNNKENLMSNPSFGLGMSLKNFYKGVSGWCQQFLP